MTAKYQSDVIIIGGGLAGLTAALDLIEAGKKVVVLERDQPDALGGLAKRSFGGVMLVDTPEQQKMKIKDSPELALKDWHSYANFGKKEELPRQWAREYVYRTQELIYPFMKEAGIKFLPVVNWPERGVFRHGNSVPRWHITWGTGLEIINKLVAKIDAHPNRKNLEIHYDHRVERFIRQGGRVKGCAGKLESTNGTFEARADVTLIASGGICGGDLSKVIKNWYKPWGKPPRRILNGAHRFGDGLLHDVVDKMGGRLTNLEKQWHYAAGIHHPQPKMDNHGLSLVPPRSAIWIDGKGNRLGSPVPCVPYTDTRYFVEQICKSPGKYSWQIMNYAIAKKELAVSGSEFMTAFVQKSKLKLLKNLLFGNKALVNRLINESRDVVVGNSLGELVEKMNQLEDENQVDLDTVHQLISDYDAEIDRGPAYFNDEQLRRLMNFRTYRGDRIRTCKFQKINDPGAKPLIAIREFILARKSLGGIQTDLNSQVLDKKGKPIAGLYAVGEAAGFGGGGIHGQGALEGTFLGGCILTARIASKHIGTSA
jgi:hypothetical protein